MRWERAPCDHPALIIPAGHPGDENGVTADGDTGLAAAEFEVLPAVGAGGRDEKLGPLRSFEERVQP